MCSAAVMWNSEARATQAERGHLPAPPQGRPWIVLLEQHFAWTSEDVGLYGLFEKVISSIIMDGNIFPWFMGLARIMFSW